MKPFLLAIVCLFIYAKCCYGQVACGDSSSHFEYQSIPGDSFRVVKSILGNDDSKIILGAFLQGSSLATPFLCKITGDGAVAWMKKLHASATNTDQFILSSILGEAPNGNIFIASVGSDPMISPFIVSVFYPDGSLLSNHNVGIRSNGTPFSEHAPSLIMQNGNDSMLLVFNFGASAGSLDAMLTVSMDINGQIGQALQTDFPAGFSYSSRFKTCSISANEISLYGCSEFDNACLVNSRPQPAYVYLKINRHTGEVIDRKAFCSPSIGVSIVGSDLGDGSDYENTSVTILKNGNIVFTRRIWGLDPANRLNIRLFKVSTFDSGLNHLKSEYIYTHRSFQWFIDWDYELAIDSAGNRVVTAHDRVLQQLLYAKGNLNGIFNYQRIVPFAYSSLNQYFNIASYQEPAFFISALFAASGTDRSYIESVRVLEQDTASACFGLPADLFFTQPASVTPINWGGAFISKFVDLITSNMLITEEDYPLQRTIICNQTHFCDAVQLEAVTLTCHLPDSVKFIAHRNPGCITPIKFLFDTVPTVSYSLINDSTILLRYAHAYQGNMIASLEGCTAVMDTLGFSIMGDPAVALGNDFIYCPGKSYRLSAHDATIQQYQWQDGTTDSFYIATRPGLYTVATTDFCNRTDKDSVYIINRDFGIYLGADTTLCAGQTLQLQVPAGYEMYAWQPLLEIQQQQPNVVQIHPERLTTYILNATVFEGCVINDSITVDVQACPDFLYFPNSFTPNNDGLNDVFAPVAGSTFLKYELRVYNRWGQMVFMSRQPGAGWSGSLNGNRQFGTFVWQCLYQFNGKNPQLQKGTVTIVD